MPSLGAPEIIIILVLALLVFGPKRLPEMGRSLGRTVREFKKASDTARKEFGVDEIEKELKGVKSELKDVQKTVTDVKGDLKIDVDAEAAKPSSATPDGATAGAASAAAAVVAQAEAAPRTGEEVLVGEVVDEGPAFEGVPISSDDALVDGPVDVAGSTADFRPPAVSSEALAGDDPDAGDKAALADAPPRGA